MKALQRGVILFAVLTTAACLYDFPDPLGPVSDGFIEPRLLGRWACAGAEGSALGTMRVMDFDGKQYHVSFGGEGEEPEQHRAYASRIGEATFWNVQSLEPTRDTGWSVLEYSFSESGRLLFRGVRSEPFEGVSESPERVRELLEDNLDNSEFFEPLLECTPLEPADAR